MNLFWQEHKKLWRAGLTRLAVAALLVLTLGLQIWAMQYAFGTMRDDGSHRLNGYANIRASQAYAARWPLVTDAAVQDMARVFQQRVDHDPNADVSMTGYEFVQSLVASYWPELEDYTQTYPTLTLWYLDPAALTGLYERREQQLRDYLDTQFADPADRQFFLAMDSRVDKPLAYGWRNGWGNLLANGIGGLGQLVMPVVLALALAPVFAGERRRGMVPLQATALRGRGGLAAAKLASGLAFTVEVFLLFAAGIVAVQWIWLGPDGWDLPIQLIKMLATAPMNMLQAEVYEFAYVLCSSLGLAGLLMLASACLPGSTPALVAGLLAVWLPQMFGRYLPWAVQQYLQLLPFVGGAEDIFRQNLYHWFGLRLWSPGPLLAVPPAVGALCLPLAVRAWCRKRRA